MNFWMGLLVGLLVNVLLSNLLKSVAMYMTYRTLRHRWDRRRGEYAGFVQAVLEHARLGTDDTVVQVIKTYSDLLVAAPGPVVEAAQELRDAVCGGVEARGRVNELVTAFRMTARQDLELSSRRQEVA